MAIVDSNAPFRSAHSFGRYQTLRRIAVGGMAELHLGCAVGPGDFRKVVALKRLLPQHALDPQLLHMFLDEARLMARMAHPHIPQVYEVDDGSGTPDRVPYFAMEYVHGTDLRAVLNEAAEPMPIPQLLAVGAAVASGLHYAHEMKTEGGEPLEIVHRDVSPSNVLISFGGTVKITDFGVAKWLQQRSLTYSGQLKGKFAHMSPEQCQGQPLDRRSDVFALGTLLYEMATGRPAYAADSDFELMSQIVNADIRPPERVVGDPLPGDLSAIIVRTLKRSRDQRYANAQEVQLELERFARDHRLVISPLGLAEYLATLFSARVSEWRDAMKSGFTLAEHLQRSPAQGPTPARAESRAPRRARGGGERTATDAYADPPVAAAVVAARAGAAAAAPEGGATAPDRRGWRMSAGIVAVGLVLSLAALAVRRSPVGLFRHSEEVRNAPVADREPPTIFGPTDPASSGAATLTTTSPVVLPSPSPSSSSSPSSSPSLSPSSSPSRPKRALSRARVVVRPTFRAKSEATDPPRPATLSPRPNPTPDSSRSLPSSAPQLPHASGAVRVWDPDSPVPP